MILSKQNHNTNYLNVDDYKFEWIQSFKYLEAEVNENVG